MHQALLSDLNKLLEKHKVALAGNVKLIDTTAEDFGSSDLSITDVIEYGNGTRDMTGPFLMGSVVRKQLHKPAELRSSFQVMSDIEPYQSPIDKTMITSRKDLREHEKKHDVVRIGTDNDSKYKKMAEELREQGERI